MKILQYLCGAIASLCYTVPLLAQQPPCKSDSLPPKHFTFTIRKQQDTTKSTTLPIPEVVAEKMPDSTKIAQKDTAKVYETPFRFPRLSKGEFGLMWVAAFERKPVKPQVGFVIFQYTVNELGWASDIEIVDANDRELQYVLYKNLQRARWQPAQNAAGEPIPYRYPLQIALILKDNQTHHENDSD